MTPIAAPTDLPDGIAPDHLDPRAGGGRGQRRWLALILLSVLMLAALLGLFGGGPARTMAAQTGAARLEVATPRVIRNGEFFETRVRITARHSIDKAVVAVAAPLWRDMTINTMIPAPAEETMATGSFRFDYGPLDAGEVLEIKIDGQINPPLFAGTRGAIAVLDGERELARVPVAIRVLP